MNKLFHNIAVENYQDLIRSFDKSKKIFWKAEENKLIHPGEYGKYREDIIKRFLKLYIPERFGISSGFIINPNDEISSQCDIIIYDKSKTPRIQNYESQRFFPIETVIGVGEVKSTINSETELNSYLIKLSKFKKMRYGVKNSNPYFRPINSNPYNLDTYPADNISTFLICYKFNFEVKNLNYGEIEQKFWHNMVLSLQDGLHSYMAEETRNIYYSFSPERNFNHCFLPITDEELPSSVGIFLAGISFFCNNITRLEFQSTQYLTDNVSDKII